jgi:ATP-binding cassette, subfamily C (CFTR/MRP), member 1
VLNENGTISEQGQFDVLAATGGYVSTFNLGQPDWDFTPDEKSYHIPNVTEKEKVIQTDDDLEAEANRGTGDFTIYRYYFDSVGWFGIVVFLVCISGFVFCISFPSKSIISECSKGQD